MRKTKPFGRQNAQKTRPDDQEMKCKFDKLKSIVKTSGPNIAKMRPDTVSIRLDV